MEFIHARDAAHHVLEAGFVGLVVGNVFDRRRASSAFLHAVREALDGAVLDVANVDDFTDRTVGIHEAVVTLDGFAHVAVTPTLLASALDTAGGVDAGGR